MANEETTRVSAHVDRVLDASTTATAAGAGAGVPVQSVVPAVTHATQAPATTGLVVAALHLLRVAEMAAQVASSEPAATQVLAVTVEMVGVAALVAAVHD